MNTPSPPDGTDQSDATSSTSTNEKLMSITLAEFEASLERLSKTLPLTKQHQGYQLHLTSDQTPLGPTALLTFQALAGVTLGGLMKLPRAKVTIEFHGATSKDRTKFLQIFDKTFQRGGG